MRLALAFLLFGISIVIGFPPTKFGLVVSKGTTCTVSTNALVFTLKTSFGNTSNNNWYSSASFTPAADSTLVVFGAFSPAANETFGDSVGTYTWWRIGGSPGGTNYNTLASPAGKLTAWVTQMPPGTTPGSMTVSLTNTSGTGGNLHVVQITGADTNLAWGSNAVVQSVLIASNATANPQITISAPNASGSNALLVAFADDVNSSSDNAAGNGQTELAESAYNTPAHALSTYYLTNLQNSQTLHTNIATSRDWASIALEIRAGTNKCAGGGGGGCTVASGDTFNESFEGTGYENTWTETGTMNEDAALPGTSPCAGLGSQCLEANWDGVATKPHSQWNRGSTLNATLYYRFYFYLESLTLQGAEENTIFNVNEQVSTVRNFSIEIANDGGIHKVRCVTDGTTTTGQEISAATWYRVEVKYVPNNGAGASEFKVFDASNNQIGSTQTFNTGNNWLQYLTAGIRSGDNTRAFHVYIDGIGVTTTGYLGQ